MTDTTVEVPELDAEALERKQRSEQVKGTERRRVTVAMPMEMRAGKGNAVEFRGYASTTEEPYDLGWYTEVVRQGAFTKTLSEDPDVQLLVNHDGLPLARTTSGTMSLLEDGTGLLAEAELDSRDSRVRDLMVGVERGDVTEMSFAFWTIRQLWSPDYTQRDLIELSLDRGDVSIVSYGANPTTSIATLRSALARGAVSPDELRALLADAEPKPDEPVGMDPRLVRARMALARR